MTVSIVFNCYTGASLIDICLLYLYTMKKYNFENSFVVISHKNDKYIVITNATLLRNQHCFFMYPYNMIKQRKNRIVLLYKKINNIFIMLLYIFHKFTSEQKLLIFVFVLYRVHELIILSLLFIFLFYVHRQ